MRCRWLPAERVGALLLNCPVSSAFWCAAVTPGAAGSRTGGFGPSDAIALASALISAIAMVVSALNRRTAKRALTLAERQDARRQVPFGLHLNEAVQWPAERARVVAANVRVANPADRAVTVVSAALHVTYTRPDALVMTVKVPAVDDVAVVPINVRVEPTPMPLRIEANDAASSWFVFVLDDDLTGGSPVDRFEVTAIDVHGRSERLVVTAFHEARA